MRAGKLNKKQVGVLRTNCLDCLDRTNICQAFYAFKAFVHQLEYFKTAGILNEDSVTQAQNNSPEDDNHTASQLLDCMKSIRKMWAENGDEISRQYAGTGSTSTEVTVNGKTSIKGKISHKMTSIERFFKNNINSKDDVRQDSIDFLTNPTKKAKTKIPKEMRSNMFEPESKHTEVSNFTMCVFSWNIGGNEPRYEMDFVNVFKSDEFQSSPDIAVIGFQETLTLNALNCLKGHDKGRVEALKSHAEDALDDLDPEARYQFVAQSPMVGLLLMVFVKDNLKGRITDISTSKVKSGFGGNVGNKGAVMVRFNLDKTSICLCCAHLESGHKKEKERRQNIREIVESGFSDQPSEYNFLNHDVKIFFGDLNFRINLGYEDVTGILENMSEDIKDDQMHILLNNDQLNQCKIDYSWLYHYKEMPIRFLPTYKYDKNSNIYDTSKKKRIPAWTDRILWYHNEEESGGRGSKYISPILYERRETTFSDHRPVVAYFEIHAHGGPGDTNEKTAHHSIGSKKVSSFVVKKADFAPVEVKKERELDDFDLFSSPQKTKEDVHHEFDISQAKSSQMEESKKPSPDQHSHMEDLLQFDNNLIDIQDKEADDNLIDFGSKKSHISHHSHGFYPHGQNFHNKNIFTEGQESMQATGFGYSMNNHFPMHVSQPMGIFQGGNGLNKPRKRSSVPRKPSADLLDMPSSNGIPQKQPENTQDFFQF